MSPVYIEKIPMRRMMYRPLQEEAEHEMIISFGSSQSAEAKRKWKIHAQEERLEHLSQASLAELPLEHDHERSGEEGEEAVTEVSEHDGEEEGKGDDGDEARVDFLVGRDTVRVDDGLETLSKGRRSVEGGRGVVGSELGEDGRDGSSSSLL
jgi:hypothetical protein